MAFQIVPGAQYLDKETNEMLGPALQQMGQFKINQMLKQQEQNELYKSALPILGPIKAQLYATTPKEARSSLYPKLLPEINTYVPGTLGKLGIKVTPDEEMAFARLRPEQQSIYLRQKLAEPGNEAYGAMINQILGNAPTALSNQQGGFVEKGQPSLGATPSFPTGKLNQQQLANVASLALQKQGQEIQKTEAVRRTKADVEKRLHDIKTENKERDLAIAKGASNFEQRMTKWKQVEKVAGMKQGRMGNLQLALQKVNLGDFFRTPMDQFLDKTLNSIVLEEAANSGIGGRMMASVFNVTKKSLLTMGNTPEAAQFIAKQQQLFLQMAKAVEDEKQAVIKEYGDNLPRDYISIAEKRAEPRLKALGRQAVDMINNRNVPVKSGETLSGLSSLGGFPDPSRFPFGHTITDNVNKKKYKKVGFSGTAKDWKEIPYTRGA